LKRIQNNWFWLLILASLWGPSFLFIKIAVQDIPPFTLVAFRLTIASVVLFILLRARKQPLPQGWRAWRKFLFVGFFANALPFSLFAFGEQFTDSGPAAIINGSTPIFTVIFAHYFIAEERLTPDKLGGMLLGFLGVAMLFWDEFLALVSGQSLQNTDETLGLLAFLLAAICYGVAIVFGRLKLRGLPPLVGPTAQLMSASAMMLPLALIVERPFTLQVGTPAMLSATVLGLFGTGLAYIVYYRLVDNASATFLSLVTYILPPIGVVLGIVFLNERPNWYSIVGLAIIIIGVMIVNGRLRLQGASK
jgi:drug/metabolite transporter (DMT)-like permease